MRSLVWFKSASLAAVLLASATGFAFADAQIVVSVAGEAFKGPPEFEVRVGNKVVGQATVSKAIDTETVGRLFSSAKPASYLQSFTFVVKDADFKPGDHVTVGLINDKYEDLNRGYDRNIFVNSITINGMEVEAGDLVVMANGKPEKLDYQAGLLPVYHNDERAQATPPVTGWPAVAPERAAELMPRSGLLATASEPAIGLTSPPAR